MIRDQRIWDRGRQTGLIRYFVDSMCAEYFFPLRASSTPIHLALFRLVDTCTYVMFPCVFYAFHRNNFVRICFLVSLIRQMNFSVCVRLRILRVNVCESMRLIWFFLVKPCPVRYQLRTNECQKSRRERNRIHDETYWRKET